VPEGLAVEVGGLFSGAATSLSRRAAPVVARLGALVSAHPHGPVLVEAQAAQRGAAGDRIAARRARALLEALAGAGAARERLRAEPIPAALRGEDPVERVRLVFVAYVADPAS